MLFPSRSVVAASGESDSSGDFADRQCENIAVAPRVVGIVDSPHDPSDLFPIDGAVAGYQHRRVRTVPVHRLETENRFWPFSQLLPEVETDLIHAINTIPLNAKRFVVTLDGDPSRHFASASPWQVRLGQRILDSPSCKAILVRSEIAARLFGERCQASGLEGVMAKLIVFGGMLDATEVERDGVLRSERTAISRQDNGGAMKLIFVGENGLNLGLLPVLDAFEALRAAGVNVKLTIVSSLTRPTVDRVEGSVLGRFAPSRDSVRERIQAESSIKLFNSRSRQRIRSLIASHDILLLPSLVPVSGWQVIDAALGGVPAISSNVFSLPELVCDGSTGLVVPLPLDRGGNWVGESFHQEQKLDAIVQANHVIRDSISEAVVRLDQNRGQLKRLGTAAAAKMQAEYGNEFASQQLRQVYDHACH